MKYLPKNTLAHFDAAPQRKPISLSHMATKSMGKVLMEYRKDCGTTSPDKAAVRFYALNHFAAVLKSKFTPNEKLPEWAVTVLEAESAEVAEQSKRQFFYILAIIAQEARHLRPMGTEWYAELEQKFGKSFRAAVENDLSVEKLQTSAPDCDLRTYVAGVSHVFYKGKWNGGYGGKKWGMVADCLLSCIEGKTSMEAMVDTAYTLSHNNGPIYNKGMMYDCYNHTFLKILDIQRSGQMPEFLKDIENYGIAKPTELKEVVKIMYEQFPNEFGQYVDWYKVSSLGALGKYDEEKKAQVKKHPKVLEAVIWGKFKMMPSGKTFDVAPGESVELLERVAA